MNRTQAYAQYMRKMSYCIEDYLAEASVAIENDLMTKYNLSDEEAFKCISSGDYDDVILEEAIKIKEARRGKINEFKTE